ncbi:HsdR family type I site-specific deoxyribonuclease [Candidatus Phytoplasma solani]|uniref:Type I restriction enzyme endonuclease subunit n=1 Tax=Candidatus Phytoplasma solani TaxID=69896 RepID=A0A421NX58_9MOLU|nr:HsdR family type I site-specific deoxyribonuclease [Candidatus Phytoplasma solani]RMI88621.1 type I restriction enzyme subunit R [Candidatus Phytoplasma solani]
MNNPYAKSHKKQPVTNQDIKESERVLQNKCIERLKLGYEEIKITSNEDVINNFKKQFIKYNIENKINADFHSEDQLSQDWFLELKKHLKLNDAENLDIKDIYYNLRKGVKLNNCDKTDTFKLNFINKNYQKWCHNKFQVAQEVLLEDAYGARTRYDIVLFVNGLPVVLIELKQRGENIDRAFEDIQGYLKNTKFQPFFQYLQFFVISNGTETQYFANQNQNKINEFNKSRFTWAKDDNTKIREIVPFINDFLSPCRLVQIISCYLIYHQERKKIMIAQAHQVRAVEKLMAIATIPQNDKQNNICSHIWHATGSGKTLTAYFLCRNLQQYFHRNTNESVSICFLVHSRDLDIQTIDEFTSYEKDSVQEINSTQQLFDILKNPHGSYGQIIVSTIHKVDIIVKEKKYNNNILANYKKKPIVFVIDECHHSQSGEMHTRIKQAFPKGIFLALTGTPIFLDNKSTTLKLTNELFGKCAHKYTLLNALNDEVIIPCRTFNRNESDNKSNNKLRIRKKWIVDYILKNFTKYSNGNRYNALFAVDTIHDLIEYYMLLKDEIKNANLDLKIAAIYSQNSQIDNSKNQSQVNQKQNSFFTTIYQDFCKIFYPKQKITNDINVDQEKFRRDVAQKMKDNKINLLLVVDMFLTGFDSRRLNALYLDKNLTYHTLIQAFARTIRKDNKDKEYGNIFCFQTDVKAQTDAFKLFEGHNVLIHSKKSKEDLSEEYLKRKEKYQEILNKVQEISSNIQDTIDQGSPFQLKKIVKIYQEYTDIKNRIQQFDEYNSADFNNELSPLEEQKLISHVNLVKKEIKKFKKKEDTKTKKKSMSQEEANSDFDQSYDSSLKLDRQIIWNIEEITNIAQKEGLSLNEFKEEIKNIQPSSSFGGTNDSSVSSNSQEQEQEQIISDYIELLDKKEKQGQLEAKIPYFEIFKDWLEHKKEEELEQKYEEFCFDSKKKLKHLIEESNMYEDAIFKSVIENQLLPQQVSKYATKKGNQYKNLFFYNDELREKIFSFIVSFKRKYAMNL